MTPHTRALQSHRHPTHAKPTQLENEHGRGCVSRRVVSFGVYELPLPFLKPGYFEVGVPRRPEIPAQEFASSVECRLLGQLAFDAATFGTAANNGQMIAEVTANHRSNEVFRAIGMHVTGRTVPERASARGSSFKLPFLKKRA